MFVAATIGRGDVQRILNIMWVSRPAGCPSSRELLSLHYIQKMPDEMKKLTVSKINWTRQSSGGAHGCPLLSCVSAICIIKTLKDPL